MKGRPGAPPRPTVLIPAETVEMQGPGFVRVDSPPLQILDLFPKRGKVDSLKHIHVSLKWLGVMSFRLRRHTRQELGRVASAVMTLVSAWSRGPRGQETCLV